MSEYIPFVNTSTDCDFLNLYYSDCEMVRLPLEAIKKLADRIPSQAKIWLDPCVDGYHHRLNTNWPRTQRAKWQNYYIKLWDQLDKVFENFQYYELLTDPQNWKKDKQPDLNRFIESLMDSCTTYKPRWISVPQLPIARANSRNKINKMLAQATGQWKKKTSWAGKLVLPIIFTNQNQLNTPGIQESRLDFLETCYDFSGAHVIWVVDESLIDQQRNTRYFQRYSKLTEFHKGIRKRFGTGVSIIAGPYWAINLVLWAKELCEHPAISLGSSYTYNISCGVPGGAPTKRIALSPLKRIVVVDQALRDWLSNTLSKLSPSDVAYSEFNQIFSNFSKLNTRRVSLAQSAGFYKNWLKTIENNPKAGRKFALYQDLSSAYVIGSQLSDLPSAVVPNASATIRKAGKVAEQLMLSCL